MPIRSTSISSGVGRIASNEARAMKAAMRCCANDCAGLAETCSARRRTFMVSVLPSAAPARDDVGFVEEPQASVPAQYLLRGVEIASVIDYGGEAVVFDLGHVDRSVPGGEQGRGAD